MSIENEKLKIQCPACQKSIILTFNTTHCPKCHTGFKAEDVHQLFFNYESQLANSKLYHTANKLESVSNSLKNTGDALSNIGCALMLLPLALICLAVLWALLQ
ncbi:hypothetical protein [Enterococcus sp. AZ072]|uniref:hypothetical protein n=1 Tax=unclassified Enterococcus TaxID=2608891 RepID=UPI003D2E57AD